jgi:hypothetical protein
LTGWLALAFAIGMIAGVGIHAPLNYSVFAVSAGAFILAAIERHPFSIDSWRDKSMGQAAMRPR